jgi:heme-degrading monooxygenase HmoA
MFARMFTIEGRPEQLDEFSRLGENKVLPALQRLDGFEGSLVLANRQNGHILIVTFWHSEEAMRRGEGASHWFRVFVAEAAGGEVTGVERYEVVHPDTEGDAALTRAWDLRVPSEVAALADEYGSRHRP